MRASMALVVVLLGTSGCAPTGAGGSAMPSRAPAADYSPGPAPDKSCAPHVQTVVPPAATPVPIPSLVAVAPIREVPLEAGGVGRVAAVAGRLWIMSFDGTLAFDPSSGMLREYAGLRGTAITGDASRLWITNFDDGRVWAVDPADGHVIWQTVVPGNPEDLELTERGLWVSQHRRGSATRLDPATGASAATVEIPCAAGLSGPDAFGLGPSGLWLTIPNTSAVALIDPDTDSLVGLVRMMRAPCGPPLEVAGVVWTASCEEGADLLASIDPATRQERPGVSLGQPGDAPFPLAGGVWLKAGVMLLRLDAGRGLIDRAIKLGEAAAEGTVLEAYGSVWLIGPTAIRQYPLAPFGG